MKKIILYFSLFITALPMAAQTQLSIEAGTIVNDILKSDTYTKEKAAYKVGVFYSAPFFPSYFDKENEKGKSTWETGIHYKQKGIKATNFLKSSANYIKDLDITLDYIQIPFMLGTRYNHSPNNSFAIKAGIYGAYAFSGKGKLTGIDDNNTIFTHEINNLFKDEQFLNNGTVYPLDKFKNFEAGIIAGIEEAILKNKIIIRLFWEQGLTKISSYDKNMKNHSFSVTIAYNFK
jgi:hypothetical protein